MSPPPPIESSRRPHDGLAAELESGGEVEQLLEVGARGHPVCRAAPPGGGGRRGGLSDELQPL